MAHIPDGVLSAPVLVAIVPLVVMTVSRAMGGSSRNGFRG